MPSKSEKTKVQDEASIEARLGNLLDKLRKDHGDYAVIAGTDVYDADVGAVSTGSPNLDDALSVGGIPRSRCTEIYGPESAGKSTLALSVMAQGQRMGLEIAYIDTEHALIPEWADKIGLDINQIVISQPSSAEQALNICREMVRSGQLGLIVLDSVAALASEVELDKAIGDRNVAPQARLMSEALRQLCHDVYVTQTALVFVNQVRENVGAVGNAPRENTPGGRALKFYSHVRIDLRRIEMIRRGNDIIGSKVRARVVKSKVGPPFRTAEFEILYDRGIDPYGEYLDRAVRAGIISKRGNYYYFNEHALGNGREVARQRLRDDFELCQNINELVAAPAVEVEPVGSDDNDTGDNDN